MAALDTSMAQMAMNAAQQQEMQDRPAPISYQDWQGGSWNGKQLEGRQYYDNWANDYYAGDTDTRNELFQTHGLQNNYGGWAADDNVAALSTPYNWAGMQPGASSGYSFNEQRGQGGPAAGRAYGRGQNIIGRGGYLDPDRDGVRGYIGGKMMDGIAAAERAGNRFGGEVGQGDAEDEFNDWGGY